MVGEGVYLAGEVSSKLMLKCLVLTHSLYIIRDNVRKAHTIFSRGKRHTFVQKRPQLSYQEVAGRVLLEFQSWAAVLEVHPHSWWMFPLTQFLE